MPPRAAAAIDWDGFIQLWAIPEAEAFLSQAASSSLPKRGRLQQLLVKTQQILSRRAAEADDLHYNEAKAAVQAKAVILLARLMHVLQQSPCLEVTAIVVTRPFDSVWFCVVSTLAGIVASVQEKKLDTWDSPERAAEAHIEASCKQQLKEAAGM